MFAHERRLERPSPPIEEQTVSIWSPKTRTQLRTLGQLRKGAAGKLLTSPEHPVIPTLAMQAQNSVHTPGTTRFSLSGGQHQTARGRGRGGRGEGQQDSSICNLFSLGVEGKAGGDYSTSFRSPRGKSRPSFKARLKQIPPNLQKGGGGLKAGVD